MVDMAAISGLMGALNAALDISKTLVGVRDQAHIQSKVIELNREIISAQQSAVTANMAQISLLEEIRKLKEHIAELEAWDAEKQRYELKEIAIGAFTYALKPDAEGTEPPHWICAVCYQQAKKSILQQHVITNPLFPPDYGRVWYCSSCTAKIRTPFEVTPGP